MRTNDRRMFIGAVMAMALLLAVTVAVTGCSDEDPWENYEGTWNDPGGSKTALLYNIQPWTMTVNSKGQISFEISSTAGDYANGTDMYAEWDDDSFTSTSTPDAEGEWFKLEVNFASSTSAAWTLTGNLNWLPVSGTLSR